jgi:hypothetical protein
MNSGLHRYLQLPVKFNPISFTVNETKSVDKKHFSAAQLDSDFTSWLQEHKLSVLYGTYFYNQPNIKYGLHIDRPDTTVKHAHLNFVFNGKPSWWVWYKLKSSANTSAHSSGMCLPNTSFKEEDCEEIYRAACTDANEGQASIINGSVIHSLINGGQTRHCYLLYLGWNNQPVFWNDLVERLQSYIVEEIDYA